MEVSVRDHIGQEQNSRKESMGLRMGQSQKIGKNEGESVIREMTMAARSQCF